MNLDDTSRCGGPGHLCEACGAKGPGLVVHTVTLGRVGVACLTLCRRCWKSGVVPPMPVGVAFRLIGQHCEHLGIDLDRMAAELEAGDR
jgi:hypothetical protein